MDIQAYVDGAATPEERRKRKTEVFGLVYGVSSHSTYLKTERRFDGTLKGFQAQGRAKWAPYEFGRALYKSMTVVIKLTTRKQRRLRAQLMRRQERNKYL